MDEFKPEDELKTDPSDRRPGRTRQSSERDSDPQINFDDVDLDADDRRPSRTRKAREESDESYEEEELEESAVDEERVERRPRKRKKAPAAKPASRQYLMMGLGILVLLLLIVGIGSALKSPADKSGSEQASSEKSVNLTRPTARSLRRARLRLSKRRVIRRMSLCRRSPLRQPRGRHLPCRKASSALKCRAI